MKGDIENQMVMLLLTDRDFVSFCHNRLNADHFDSAVAGECAGLAISFYKEFGSAVGEDFYDYMRDNITDKDLLDLVEVYVNSSLDFNRNVNKEYIKSLVSIYTRDQILTHAFEEAQILASDGEFDKAKDCVLQGFNEAADGDINKDIYTMRDKGKFMRSVYEREKVLMPSGIKALDKTGFRFYREELVLVQCPSNVGKTWALVHFGKTALVHGLNILHVTLEDSAGSINTRYAQNIACLSDSGKRETVVDVDGRSYTIKPYNYNKASRIEKALDTIKNYGGNYFLVKRSAKKFMVGDLEVLLYDKEQEGCLIDVALLDYDDYIKPDISTGNPTLESQEIYSRLFGVCSERNILMFLASQTNKASFTAKVIGPQHTSTDIQRVAKASTVFSINQSEVEEKSGWARLHLIKRKRGKKGITIMISQCLNAGQFCLTSKVWDRKDDEVKEDDD